MQEEVKEIVSPGRIVEFSSQSIEQPVRINGRGMPFYWFHTSFVSSPPALSLMLIGDVERKTKSRTMRVESATARKRESELKLSLIEMPRSLLELEISEQPSLSPRH